MDEKRETREEIDCVELGEADLESVCGGTDDPPPPPPELE